MRKQILIGMMVVTLGVSLIGCGKMIAKQIMLQLQLQV